MSSFWTESSSSTSRMVTGSVAVSDIAFRMVETTVDLPTLGVQWRRPDERSRSVRAPAAAPSSGRSTRGWCAGPGFSSRCRCCSPPSRSGGRSRCRRRRCRPRSTRRSQSSSRASSRELYPDRSPGSAGAIGAASWLREQLVLYGFDPPQEDHFTASIPGRGRVELTNLSLHGAGRVAAPDRDHRPPRQHRRGAGSERQRVRHGSAGRARPGVRAGDGDDHGLDAALAHARLRLDRRRRVRRARGGAVRRNAHRSGTTPSR